MRSRTTLAPPVAAAQERQKRAVSPVASTPDPLSSDRPARGENSTPTSSFGSDPLFGMAIASVILLAFLAALMI